ncbi:MAG: alpha-amylase family protein [Lentisphaeria bacterium]
MQKSVSHSWLPLLAAGLVAGLAAPGLRAADGNLLDNGGFEAVTATGAPQGWETVISSPKVRFTATVVPNQAKEGAHCLKVVTDYTSVPDVYGCMKTVIPCEPMTEYQVTVYVRSEGAGGNWFGGGRNWAWINGIPQGVYGWTRLDGWYRTGPDETELPLLLQVSGKSTLYFDAIKVVRMGPSTDPTLRPPYQAWPAERLKQSLAWLKATTPEQKRRLNALTAAKANTDYARIKLACIEAYLPAVEKRIGEAKYALACTVMLDEMEQLAKRLKADLAQLQQDPKAVPPAYHYQTGTIRLDGFAQICDVRDPVTGKVAPRPAILNGFGHFFTVSDQMAAWQERGCNFIHIENGPQCVSTQPDQTLRVDKKIIDDLVAKLQAAAKNNVAVTLLISPHYLPNSAGAPWLSDAPGAWAYYEAYLRTLLPRIKDIPSLHSIILSNEPHCFATPSDPYQQQAWRRHLRQTYPSIADLNQAYGTKYAGFEEVPMPGATTKANFNVAPVAAATPDDKSTTSDFTRQERPWIYDWVACNEERFGAWHRRMAALVHEVAPAVPVHAKITGGYLMAFPFADGVNHERFAEFTQFCGFDEVGGVRVIYDLASSFQRAPAINSENHLLQPDFNFDQLNHERLYCDLFAQAMHGQAASAAWVYEPYYDDLATNTFSIRPAGMEAVARAGMDLMRVAPALAAIQNAPRRVAVLYSPLSMWYNDQAHPTWRTAWGAFFGSGLRVRFLSEKQLQADQVGDTAVLILPEAQVVEPATVAALERFVKGGGKIIAAGRNLEFTPGWKPLDPKHERALAWRRLSIATPGWEKQLPALAEEAGVRPAVRLVAADGRPLTGVHWLSGTLDGKTVVAAVNASGKPVTFSVQLAGKPAAVTAARDLLRDRAATLPGRLENYQAAVLELD